MGKSSSSGLNLKPSANPFQICRALPLIFWLIRFAHDAAAGKRRSMGSISPPAAPASLSSP